MTKVDDAMIDRFDSAAKEAAGTPRDHALYPPPDWREVVRAGLEAALAPPPPPEVEVTREMADAGGEEWRRCQKIKEVANKGWCGEIGWSTNDFATRIYRAMRALEPRKEAKCEHHWTDDTAYELGGPLVRIWRCRKCGVERV